MIEIDFLPVGNSNGDAITVRYGNSNDGYYVHLIDGGYTETSKDIIDHIRINYGQNFFINHMVLSHADNDHAAGLIDVISQMRVENLWMNRPWLYAAEILPHMHGNYTLEGLVREIRNMHPYLVQLERLANAQGTIIREVFQGVRIGIFTVLAPSRARYVHLLPDIDRTPTSYREEVSFGAASIFKSMMESTKRWFDENWDLETLSNKPNQTSASNETSVVQYAEIDGSRILLTADVGPVGLEEAANYLDYLGINQTPTFVQVPHHGSRRNVTPWTLDRLIGSKALPGQQRGVAYCSVGKGKSEYPRGQVKNAFIRRGYPTYVTRDRALCHHVGGIIRLGWDSAVHEPFSSRVEE